MIVTAGPDQRLRRIFRLASASKMSPSLTFSSSPIRYSAARQQSHVPNSVTTAATPKSTSWAIADSSATTGTREIWAWI